MNDRKGGHDDGGDRVGPHSAARRYELLERVTAVALSLVAAVLLWILAAGAHVGWVRLPSENWEVAMVLVLFTSALALVGLLALLESRG